MVTVYEKERCVQCNATKRELDKNNVPFKSEDITSEENQDKLKEFLEMGFTSAPIVVFSDGTIISGFRPDTIRNKAAAEIEQFELVSA